MNLVDANVLLYAVNQDDPKHSESREWLDGALSEGETVGFAWTVILAFIRLSTKVSLFPNPLPVAEALIRIEGWLSHPSSVVVDPTARHVHLLAGLLAEVGTGANLVNDAHVAALALEHEATVVSYDNDFDRFPGVRWRRPVDVGT